MDFDNSLLLMEVDQNFVFSTIRLGFPQIRFSNYPSSTWNNEV